MITREQLLIPGAQFLAREKGSGFSKGDVLTLRDNDGSQCPYFANQMTGESACAWLDQLDLIPEPAAAPTPDAKTLLDEIAMAAMAAIISKMPAEHVPYDEEDTLEREVAAGAYGYAIAMLAERAKVRT